MFILCVILCVLNNAFNLCVFDCHSYSSLFIEFFLHIKKIKMTLIHKEKKKNQEIKPCLLKTFCGKNKIK